MSVFDCTLNIYHAMNLVNIIIIISGVVMGGGATGRSPRAALVEGRQIESCQKIMLCKRNKIRLF